MARSTSGTFDNDSSGAIIAHLQLFSHFVNFPTRHTLQAFDASHTVKSLAFDKQQQLLVVGSHEGNMKVRIT